jgi:anti-repressor protein
LLKNHRRTVNARDLWEFLGSKRDFSNWIQYRIRKYRFIEGKDFTTLLLKNSGRGRPAHEYQLTWNMAKELGLIENTEKGRK